MIGRTRRADGTAIARTSGMSATLPPGVRSADAPLMDDPLPTIIAGVAGGALVAGRRSLPRATRDVAVVTGLALLGYAAWRPLSELLRLAGTRRRATEVRMTLEIAQPVERVFAFCRDFENYPRFVGALRSVHDYGDGRSRWCASTPAGDTVEWNAVTTKYVPNRVVAWETVAGSPVFASGVLRFSRVEGGTRLDVVLGYDVLGRSPLREALAALVTGSRGRQLEADLERMARYLETAPDAELEAYGV